DAYAAGAPLGGERPGQMVHRRLRGVVIALLLRLVDDEAGHRADVHDGPGLRVQHVLAEGAAAPTRAVEIDIDHAPRMCAGVRHGFSASEPDSLTSPGHYRRSLF